MFLILFLYVLYMNQLIIFIIITIILVFFCWGIIFTSLSKRTEEKEESESLGMEKLRKYESKEIGEMKWE